MRRNFFIERVVRRRNRLWWSYHVDVAPGGLGYGEMLLEVFPALMIP